MKNKNKLVTREIFFKELLGDEFSVDNNDALNNLISKLRILIKKDERISIKTIKYQGYKLEFKN